MLAKSTDKKETLSYWKKVADDWFSKYIRILYAGSDGFISCSCGCGRTRHWTQMQAGHYIVRDNYTTRYHEFNVVPVAIECNYFDETNKRKLGNFIDKKFEHRVENTKMTTYLDVIGHSMMKFTRYELQQLAKEFKDKFETLKKQKKL